MVCMTLLGLFVGLQSNFIEVEIKHRTQNNNNVCAWACLDMLCRHSGYTVDTMKHSGKAGNCESINNFFSEEKVWGIRHNTSSWHEYQKAAMIRKSLLSGRCCMLAVKKDVAVGNRIILGRHAVIVHGVEAGYYLVIDPNSPGKSSKISFKELLSDFTDEAWVVYQSKKDQEKWQYHPE